MSQKQLLQYHCAFETLDDDCTPRFEFMLKENISSAIREIVHKLHNDFTVTHLTPHKAQYVINLSISEIKEDVL